MPKENYTKPDMDGLITSNRGLAFSPLLGMVRQRVRMLRQRVWHGEAAEAFVKTFLDLIKKDGYIDQKAFHCDETGLFCNKMPQRTYMSEEEKMPGQKPLKDRFTLALCVNASDDCKV